MLKSALFIWFRRGRPVSRKVGECSIALALLSFYETKAPHASKGNLGITKEVAVEEPR
jgi:hypothetical protein